MNSLTELFDEDTNVSGFDGVEIRAGSLQVKYFDRIAKFDELEAKYRQAESMMGHLNRNLASSESLCADQAARLKWISEACAAMLSANIPPEIPPEFESAQKVFVEEDGRVRLQTLRAETASAPKPAPASRFNEDVFSALRCLGCHPAEAKRLAGIAQGETVEARLADAMRRR